MQWSAHRSHLPFVFDSKWACHESPWLYEIHLYPQKWVTLDGTLFEALWSIFFGRFGCFESFSLQ